MNPCASAAGCEHGGSPLSPSTLTRQPHARHASLSSFCTAIHFRPLWSAEQGACAYVWIVAPRDRPVPAVVMALLTPEQVNQDAPPVIFRCTVLMPQGGRLIAFCGLSRSSTMHLQSVVRHHDEIVAARIRRVVVFHSTVEELRNHAADLAFAVIVDPDKRLYATTPLRHYATTPGDLTPPRPGHPQRN